MLWHVGLSLNLKEFFLLDLYMKKILFSSFSLWEILLTFYVVCILYSMTHPSQKCVCGLKYYIPTEVLEFWIRTLHILHYTRQRPLFGFWLLLMSSSIYLPVTICCHCCIWPSFKTISHDWFAFIRTLPSDLGIGITTSDAKPTSGYVSGIFLFVWYLWWLWHWASAASHFGSVNLNLVFKLH